MLNDKMNILITITDSYVKYALVMLDSLYSVHEKSSIHLYVLSGDITDENKGHIEKQIQSFENEVTFIYIDDNIFEGLPTHLGYWPKVVYYRLILCDILPEHIERIIFTDVDIIVTNPIYSLYNIELGDKWIAACKASSVFMSKMQKECIGIKTDYYYVGLLVNDIKSMRENGVNFKKIKYMVQNKMPSLRQYDMDIINLFFSGKVLEIPTLDYCCSPTHWEKYAPINDSENFASIIHYVEPDVKPWKTYALYPDSLPDYIWWEHAKNTPFYNEMKSNFDKTCVMETAKRKVHYKNHFYFFIEWFRLKQRGLNISRYLRDNNLKNIAIYGTSHVAELLVDELSGCNDICIKYMLDSYATGRFLGYEIINLTQGNYDSGCDVDAIIVTPISYLKEIKEVIGECRAKIIPLDDIVNELINY